MVQHYYIEQAAKYYEFNDVADWGTMQLTVNAILS